MIGDIKKISSVYENKCTLVFPPALKVKAPKNIKLALNQIRTGDLSLTRGAQ